MILWDKMRKNFDSGVDAVRRVAVTVSERVSLESSVARLMIDKGGLETRLDKASRALGDRIYHLWAQGADDIIRDTDVQDSLKEMSELNERISDVTHNIQKVSLGEQED